MWCFFLLLNEILEGEEEPTETDEGHRWEIPARDCMLDCGYLEYAQENEVNGTYQRPIRPTLGV